MPEDAAPLAQDFALKGGYTVIGKVVDENAHPMPGVKVMWGMPSSYGHFSATSDVNGLFVLPGIPTDYARDVVAVKDGYAVAAVKVDPKDEKKATDVTLTLKPELTISGQLVAEDGKPVPDAIVGISYFADGYRSATTDDNGQFKVRQLSEGTYELAVRAPDYPLQKSQPIKAGEQNARIICRKGASIRGKVLNTQTGEPVKSFNVRMTLSTSGKVARGISSTWMNQGLEFRNEDGSFDFRQPFDLDASVRLLVTAPGYAIGDADDVTPAAPVEIKLKKGKPFVVRLSDSTTGAAINGAVVSLHYFTAGWRPSAGTAPENGKGFLPPLKSKALGEGRYEFEGVIPGPSWLLQAKAAEYTVYRNALPPELKAPLYELKLDRGGTIKGTLKPLPGVRPDEYEVWLGYNTRLTPDAQGRFEAKGLQSSDLAINQSRNSASWSLPPINVAPGATAEIVIDFPSFPALEVSATRDGQPAAMSAVSATAGQIGAHVYGIAADSVTIRVPKAGTYTLAVQSPKGRKQVQVDITHAQQSLVVELEGRSISGRVSFPNGEVRAISTNPWVPPNEFRMPELMRLVKASGGLDVTGISQCDDQGNFTFSGLPPGEYILAARTQDVSRVAIRRNVTLGKTSDLQDIELVAPPPDSGIEVVVLDDESGKPVEKPSASLSPDVLCIFAFGGDGKKIKLPPLPAGRYDLDVKGPGYVEERLANVEVKNASWTSVTARLKRGGKLKILLEGPENAPKPRDLNRHARMEGPACWSGGLLRTEPKAQHSLGWPAR